MSVQIPLDSATPNYRMGITLDDVPYIFDVRWNERDSSWYFDLLDVNEDPIRLGIKLVLGSPLGWRCTDDRFPKGILMAEDLSHAGREATIDDLGTRVVVYYFSEDEL